MKPTLEQLQVRMKKDVFGLAKGFTYPAEPSEDGKTFRVTSGLFQGTVMAEDVEVVE